MMQHILVGLDGSEYSEAALQHGLSLAKTFQATVHGLHVVDIVQVESPLMYDLAGAIGAAPQLNLTTLMRQNLELRGQQLLTQFRQACEAAHVPGVEHLATGVVPTEILRVAHDVDLIILGRGGQHTRLSKALLGSAVETVVRQGSKPTLVTTLQYYPIRKPLLATDGSPSALVALEIAAALVKALGLPLQVVHCTSAAPVGQEILDNAVARLAAAGVTCHADLYVGNAHDDLTRYMIDHGHDLLCMGAFGRRRVTEWVLGSTTQHILRTCPGPLLLCHAGSSAAPESRTAVGG